MADGQYRSTTAKKCVPTHRWKVEDGGWGMEKQEVTEEHEEEEEEEEGKGQDTLLQ